MSESREWKQLNNLPNTTLYTEFPLAFGKATAFKGLNLSCLFILADIHTMNKIYGETAKLTYEHFVFKFGMSKETVSAALKTMKEQGVIESEKQSHYVIKPKYSRKDFVKVDNYWLCHEWEINGEKKRLSRSRLYVLAFLKRMCSNPQENNTFISSQARIGKAVGLPRTTAGDSVRELIAAKLIRTEKADGNDQRKRGCSLYNVHPAIMAVKQPAELNSDKARAMSEAESNADVLHKRFMLDTEYRNLYERIELNRSAEIREIILSGGEETDRLISLEKEREQLRLELDRYFRKKKVNRKVFPSGFFKCDIIESSDI